LIYDQNNFIQCVIPTLFFVLALYYLFALNNSSNCLTVVSEN
jgi:hypothetical protein